MIKWHEYRQIPWQLGPVMLAFALLAFTLHHVYGFLSGTGADLIAPNHMPLGADYLSLWSAGWLAATGNAAGAYDPAAIHAAHRIVIPENAPLTLFHYPPTFLLLLWPFAQLPYVTSWLLFVGLTGIGYLAVLWKARPHWTTLLFALAYPAAGVNFLDGQNAFLSTTLLGLALFSARPWMQGLWWGLLTYKPQLGLPVPFALLMRKNLRIILYAGLFAALFAGLALLCFGTGSWQAFSLDSSYALEILASNRLPMERMASAFAMVMVLGGSWQAALLLQGLEATIALLCVMAIYRNTRSSAGLRGASLGLAMLMVTPHLFNYDLTLLALPLALWLREAERTNWLAGERLFLLLIWLAPFYAQPIPLFSYVNLYPALLILMQLLLIRRLYQGESESCQTVTRQASP